MTEVGWAILERVIICQLQPPLTRGVLRQTNHEMERLLSASDYPAVHLLIDDNALRPYIPQLRPHLILPLFTFLQLANVGFVIRYGCEDEQYDLQLRELAHFLGVKYSTAAHRQAAWMQLLTLDTDLQT